MNKLTVSNSLCCNQMNINNNDVNRCNFDSNNVNVTLNNLQQQQQVIQFDPVISQIRWNKTGPNPDPTFCYLQRNKNK
jgi:hypothetical protein